MRMMLAEHVQLSRADRDSIARLLKSVYLEHRAQLGVEVLPIALRQR
jgi:hypothetical protein